MQVVVRPTVPAIDTLIVGQGLAGSLLAWELEQAGQRVMVIDDPRYASASRAAGGLMNPVTGPRLALLPDLQARCEQARAHYVALGERLGRALVEPKRIRRLCRNGTERDRARNINHPWIGAWQDGAPHDLWNAPFGSVPILHAWRLDLKGLLSVLGDRWSTPGTTAASGPFDWMTVQRRGQSARWQGYSIGCVVSCEGAAIAQNPYWHALPLQADGGESLVLRLPIALDEAISSGFTLLPLEHQTYWLGATHAPGLNACGPGVRGRKVLLDALATCMPKLPPIEVISHLAGTRMATPDREPVLGRHPKHAWLAIFNGLGSRGILRAPDSAIRLAQHLVHDIPLPSALDVHRYDASCATS